MGFYQSSESYDSELHGLEKVLPQKMVEEVDEGVLWSL